jgi:plastocyanin
MTVPGPGTHVRTCSLLPVALFMALTIPAPPQALAETEQGQGDVTVHVLYRGAIPKAVEMPVTRDTETCGTTASIQSVTVDAPTGGLKDAVVTIDAGTQPGEAPLRTSPRALLNTRCAFSPHVMAIQTGVPLEIHNLDPVPHNTHITNEARTFINVALVINARPVVKKMVKPGLYLVQCNAHKFMRGYLVSSEHPYFGVTDGRGSTKIQNVPAGEHDISVWHEQLGQLRAHVTVPTNGSTTVTVEFHPVRK